MIRGWLQGFIGIAITLVILLICFAFFAVRLATRSHPVPYSESQAAVHDTVRVFRNSFGIPHIIGRSIDDVIFAQGYTHAQDRLWQMDVWRRTGRGRLAEILGPKLVQVDAFMRAVDIAGIVALNVRTIDPTSRRLMQAYSDGVNAYLRDNEGKLPFEFDALEYTPEPWSVEDCLVVGRTMAFEISLAFWTDIAYAQIALQRGPDAYRMYVPRGPGAPYVLDTTSATRSDTTLSKRNDPQQLGSAHMPGMQRMLADVRSALGMHGSSYGSNCWAVKKASGGAIVANDPHLSVSMPPKWYQNHLSAPGLNVIGLSIPGLPFVFSGRNDNLAWGFTNAMVDDVDYVAERVDPKNANYYLDAEGRRVKFRYRRDTIRIKDQPDSLIDLRFTNRSCVVSDVHLMKDPSIYFGMPRQMSAKVLNTSCLTLRWTARYRSDEILALYRINTSKTFDEFVTATQTWVAPALNFSVGTASGTVGTVVAGVVPRRGSADPHLPIPSWVAGADWSGVIPLRTMGVLVNPSRGFVASANNRTSPRTDVFIGTLFEPSSRIQRINELLAIYRDPSVRDVQVMQQDVVSPFTKKFLERIIPVLKRGMNRYAESEKQALKTLDMWDGTQSSIDVSASIYAALLQRILWNTFEDELGQQLYYDWTFVSNIPMRRIDELLDDPTHVLWDDTRTPQREDMAWIAIRSYIEAIRELRVTFKNDRDTAWKYGMMHTVTFPHLFGSNELMRPVMNQGPFDISGSHTTLNNSEWNIAQPYATRVAASMRVISDMQDSVQYSVVPGGSSGQPLHAHYADQLQLWLKGGYVRLPVGPKPDVSFRLYHVFAP
ncbi:MAG: penicillin acylase family protein [Candidatus Kapabacteria bacterium]|nr:penicillin acylase family protein [Candidatus Kapabacteria bacterium]